MSTTAFFIELVVIGVGAAFWTGLVILTVFYGWIPPIQNLSHPGVLDKIGKLVSALSTLAIVPGLPIIYVLGILVDRVADQVFHNCDRVIWGQFCKDIPKYSQAKKDAFYSDEIMHNRRLYNRSRMRICRGWAINSIIIVITLNLFVWLKLRHDYFLLGETISLLFSILFIGLGCISVWAWYKLSIDGYKAIDRTVPKENRLEKKEDEAKTCFIDYLTCWKFRKWLQLAKESD